MCMQFVSGRKWCNHSPAPSATQPIPRQQIPPSLAGGLEKQPSHRSSAPQRTSESKQLPSPSPVPPKPALSPNKVRANAAMKFKECLQLAKDEAEKSGNSKGLPDIDALSRTIEQEVHMHTGALPPLLSCSDA